MKQKPELLSPAGNMDSLIAAINGGADAVYLGLKDFSARRRAANFSYEELEKALEYAHNNNVKVYITLNTLIKDEEFEDMVETINRLNQTEIDGVIIQDLGLLKLLLDSNFNKSIQMSTQTSIYGNEGAEFFEKQGVDRVVYARETPLTEITKSNNLEVEKKVFCHGALCYAYSGQCHLSSAIGGRSGNRGSCAQPCRRKYILKKDDKKLKEDYLLSTKELNTLDRASEYLDGSVDSLKIEGRLRSPEYVYSVTKAYRNALDGKRDHEDDKDIEATFSREFTEGLIFDQSHNLSQKNPKNRGTLIGKTGEYKQGKIEIKLFPEIEVINGDGISFGKQEDFGFYVNQIFNKNNKKIQTGTKTIYLKSDRYIKPGEEVYRSFDKKRIDRLKKNALKEPGIIKKPIDFDIILKLGEKPIITGRSNEKSIKVVGDKHLEAASNKAANEEEIIKQFSKLGNSKFYLNNIRVHLENGLFIPKSYLNNLRTEVTDRLSEKEGSETVETIVLDNDNKENVTVEEKVRSVKFDSFPDIELIKDLDLDEVILTFKGMSPKSFNEMISQIKELGKSVLLTVPLVTEEQDLDNLFNEKNREVLLNEHIDGYLIPNFDFYERLIKEKGNLSDLTIEAGDSLNIFNKESARFLKETGFTDFTVSDELDKEEIKELSRFAPIRSTLIVGGKRKLMTSKNCVFDCEVCGVCPNSGWYTLTNDFGDQFDLKLENKKNIIFNSEPTLLGLAENEQPYIHKLRVNIENENKDEVKELFDKLINSKKNTNPGNYQKGVQ